MQIAYWVVAGLAALAFLATGLLKLVRPKAALRSMGQGWVEHFDAGPIKLIGVAEVLGAIGLIVPMATGIAPILSPIAAIALGVLMVGAAVTHVRRTEPPLPIVLVALCAAAAVLGFVLVG